MVASDKAYKNARRLRREMSLPEVLLWRILRQRPGGFKFRRQHPIGQYALDLYLPQIKLAIEIDGSGHDMGDQPSRDEQRDAWLASQDIATLLINAKDVLADPVAVADSIIRYCKAVYEPLHHRFAAVPLPIASRWRGSRIRRLRSARPGSYRGRYRGCGSFGARLHKASACRCRGAHGQPPAVRRAANEYPVR